LRREEGGIKSLVGGFRRLWCPAASPCQARAARAVCP
jgi:hypothetical protein